MKRLLIMAPILALAFTGFGPAHADDVYPTEGTPIVQVCKATGGYREHLGELQWRARADKHEIGDIFTACAAWAPDTASPLPDPSNPPTPHPTPGGVVVWLSNATGFIPTGTGANGVNLVGDVELTDFACGEGTIAGGENDNYIAYYQGGSFGMSQWTITDFTIEFSDGVGEVTGTAQDGYDWQNPEVRSLGGYVIVDDGATSGNCDDSAGNSEVLTVLTLTPQD